MYVYNLTHLNNGYDASIDMLSYLLFKNKYWYGRSMLYFTIFVYKPTIWKRKLRTI